MMTRFELTTVLEDARVNGLTHNLFPYPARTTPSIPRETISKLSPPGGIVLDPFCGGGTTLVEALAQGRQAVGSDLNPVAVYVSKVKTTRIDPAKLDELVGYLTAELKNGYDPGSANAADLFDKRESGVLPASVAAELPRLVNLISNQQTSDDLARLMKLVLAATCFTLEEKRMIARIADGKVSFETLFAGRLREAAKSVRAFHSQVPGSCKSQIINQDATALVDFVPSTVPKADLVVMSPPYLGVHIEYAEIMMGGRVRSMVIPKILDIPIKRKNYLISEGQYFDKMGTIASTLCQITKRGAYVCVIVGFKTDEHEKSFNTAFRSNGLRLVSRWMRPVDRTYGTRRRFHSFLSKKTAMMRHESVLFYRS
jgi:SAM-dependent methyltransferase